MHHQTGPSADGHGDPAVTTVDPIFFPPPQQFRHVAPTPDGDLGTWLAQQVALHQRQLQLHVQRIVLHAEQGSPEQLSGALVDLFIALGSAGRALRQRLLHATRQHLDQPLMDFLQDHLDGGLHADTPLPAPIPWARLSAGLSGIGALVVRERQSASPASPLELARERLDDGNIPEALGILEQTLLETPDDAELQAELLAICRATRDSASLQRIRPHLSMDPATVADWDNTIAWLDEQERRP